MNPKSSRLEPAQSNPKQQIISQQHKHGEIMESPISTGSAIPTNITIRIAQPQPQAAVQSTATQSNTKRESGDPFSVGRNNDKGKGSVHG